MARVCSAVAKSTGVACQRIAVPGSRYCVFHVEPTPLLLGAVIGAVLGLGVTEAFRFFVPSSETRQLVVAQRETGELRSSVRRLESEDTALHEDVTRYQGQLQEQSRASVEREERHAAELAKLNTKLEPFIRLAVARYPGINVDEALGKLQSQIAEVRKLASPPVLSYASHRVQASAGGPVLIVKFKRSKDAALGRIELRVSLPSGAVARITRLSPAGSTMSVQTAISADGMAGSVSYSSPPGDDPGIIIGLSAPTRVQLAGNQGLQPFAIDVR